MLNLKRPTLFNFKKITTNTQMKISGGDRILTDIEKGFEVGNRNKYLWAFGFKEVFENRSLVNEIENILLAENKKHTNPKNENEVKSIAKSVAKSEKTMFTIESTQQIEAKRGRMSNKLWELNIHGLKQRQSYSGFIISQEIRQKTIQKITHALLDGLKKGLFLTKKEIAKAINMSLRTITRYEHRYSLRNTVYKAWKHQVEKLEASKSLTRATKKEIDIRPVVQEKLSKLFQKLIKPFRPKERHIKIDNLAKRSYVESLYEQIA